MKYTYYTFILSLIFSWGTQLQAQDINTAASYSGNISLKRVEPSLSSKSKLKPAIPLTETSQDGRSSKNLVIPGKDKQSTDDALVKNADTMTGKLLAKAPSLVFEVNNSVSSPSDPAMAVGPDHVFIVYNTGFIIYDKEGNDLTGPLNVNNIFSSGGCCDLTASYDNVADRWVISYLFFGSGAEVAVSSGPDPVNSDWFVYSVSQIADYQKLSVWSDGYYLTDNTSGNEVWALERDAMLAGENSPGIQGFSLPGIVTSGFSSSQVLNVTDDNLPAVGGATVVYLQDDAYSGVSEDHIKLWTIDVDWANSANSQVSDAETFVTTPFIGVFDGGSFSNLIQPGGGAGIDALQATIMNQAQFRKFGDHNSAIFSFVVDVDASADKLAGIRWYEFRQDGDNQPWTMYQEGTYTSPDGKHAWMSSMAMDFQGNIGMGYTSMAGPTTPNPTDFRVGSYYTGRYANDPAGTMTIAEELIGMGAGDIQGNRYGDYGKLDLDPVSDKKFWFINEYLNNDIVGVFQIASDFDNDIGVVAINTPEDGALTGSEQITITIFNYGLEDVTGFDITYQIDGGSVVAESFPGTIAATTTAEYSFTTTGDFSTEGQTYTITASTMFADDQYNDNDAITKEVTHLFPNDVGVTGRINPVSGSGLTANEEVIVTITNFGSATQTSIPVFYSINNGTVVQETYTGSIAQGESDDYTFSANANLADLGDYDVLTGTELDGDADESNDDLSSVVSNFICQPASDCAGFNDGITQLQVADQDISVACGEAGYTDNTDIIFNFDLGQNPFEGALQMGYAGDYSIWIDFNDDFSFSSNELVASGAVPEADVDLDFTIDFTDFDYSNGMHTMRVRAGDPGFEGDIGDPCSDLTYGRTNDFTVNVSGVVGIDEFSFASSDIVINTLGGNQFELVMNTSDFTDRLPLTVFNSAGQTLAFYTIENSGTGYRKIIDMSHIASGVYFVRIGNNNGLNKIKRLVVE